MNKFWGSLAACILGLGASQAQAEAYISAGYGQHERSSVRGKDIDSGDLVLKLGGQVSSWADVELRAGTTLVRDEEKIQAGGADGTVEYGELYFGGGYFRAKWDNVTPVTPYLIGGVTLGRDQIDYEFGPPLNRSDDDEDNWNSVSFGGGVDLDITERLGVNLEYMRYRDDSYDIKKEGPALSVYWRL